MISIHASRVLYGGSWLGPSLVTLRDGTIAAIEPTNRAVPDRWLVPGFVDVQVNGIDDVDVSTASGAEWERLDSLLLAQGVTTWCPTLVTMPLDRYGAPLGRIADAMKRAGPPRPTIAGAHLEGPFLGRAPGAHPPDLVVDIDVDWLGALPPHVAVVTLGAEQPNAAAATRLLAERGVLVSIGHSRADDAQFGAVVDAGARLTTHLFNGMSGAHHRDPGVAVWAMTESRVAASVIADGIHLHPRTVRLAFDALGPSRAVLVTDAVAWRTGRAGQIGITLRDGAPRLPDGTLAGSTLTMDAAVRLCIDAGVAPDVALSAASSSPARLLRLTDRGRIAVGQRADLVAITPTIEIEQVWVGGEPIDRH